MKSKSTPRLRAFSLVELLTVIATIGVLSAVVMASIGRARASARTAACASNLRQVGTAAGLWSADNRGKIVPAFLNGVEPSQLNLRSWVGQLAPYVGWQKPTATTTEFASYDAIPDIFKCPERDGKLGYGYNLRYLSDGRLDPGNFGMKSYNQAGKPARTVMIADVLLRGSAGSWGCYLAAPSTQSWGWTTGPSYHHGGDLCNVLWLDGHVSVEKPDAKLNDEQSWTL